MAMAIAFIVVFPWLWLIQMRAPEFLSTTIGHDVVARMRSGQEGHRGPPGLYALLVWGTFFPWSLLLPAAIVTAWRNRHLPTTRFALAAWIGPWVMFELIAGKLPHYVLPTYPALAYLTADMLVRASRGAISDLSTGAFKIAAGVFGLIVIALGAVPAAAVVATKSYDARLVSVAAACAIIALYAGIVIVHRFNVGRILSAARAMGGSVVAMVLLLWTGFLPAFEPIRLSQNLARVFKDHDALGALGLMIDYKEPSLAFHQGGGLRERSDGRYLAEGDPAAFPEWVVVTSEIWEATPRDAQGHWAVLARVKGIAYSDRGRACEVLVLRRIAGSHSPSLN